MLACIHGPTASGKSRLAYGLAAAHTQRTGQTVEIISMDSAQVFRGMDKGTAKPSTAEQQEWRHHLINIRDPEESYSVAEFCSDVAAAAGDIRSRGHLPLLVGGTSMYLHALRGGLSDIPAIPADVREAISQEAAAQGWPAMHAELARCDPMAAARLDPNDRQRVGRFLEVFRHTGKSLLAWQAEGQRPGIAVAVLALMPEDRAALHADIASRFRAMVADGLLDEVRALRQREGLTAEHPSMRCVGYRQAWLALSAEARGEPLNSVPWVDWGIAATRQLAKRQITWLRRFVLEDPQMRVHDQSMATASNWLLAVSERETISPTR